MEPELTDLLVLDDDDIEGGLLSIRLDVGGCVSCSLYEAGFRQYLKLVTTLVTSAVISSNMTTCSAPAVTPLVNLINAIRALPTQQDTALWHWSSRRSIGCGRMLGGAEVVLCESIVCMWEIVEWDQTR